MFRKIVSNLPFSPALVGQLGFYANRLRREEATRRAGLIFVVLALVVQSFAVFSPPESANAASGNNVIYGGINSKDELLKIYDRNKDSAGHKDIQQIYQQFGITRDDIKNAKTGHFNSKDHDGKILNGGRNDTHARGKVINVDNATTKIYESYIHDFDTHQWSQEHGTTYEAVIGKRAIDGKWFAIMFACGNPLYLSHPPASKPPVAACSSLRTVALSRTDYRLDAKATIDNGASISQYIFTVQDKSGKTIATKTTSTKSTSSSTTYTFPAAGAYTIKLAVVTSEGTKTASDCARSLTISPQPVCTVNTSLPVNSPDCKPCENDKTLWYKDENCNSSFELTKKVRNATQMINDANETTAQPGDRLEYRLSVKISVIKRVTS